MARTLIILLAAGLISLGWYAYSITDSAQSSMPERPAEFSAADDAGVDTSEPLPPRPDDHKMGLSVGGVLSGMVGIIGQTALVIALVTLARKLGTWLSAGYKKPTKTRRRVGVSSHFS